MMYLDFKSRQLHDSESSTHTLVLSHVSDHHHARAGGRNPECVSMQRFSFEVVWVFTEKCPERSQIRLVSVLYQEILKRILSNAECLPIVSFSG